MATRKAVAILFQLGRCGDLALGADPLEAASVRSHQTLLGCLLAFGRLAELHVVKVSMDSTLSGTWDIRLVTA